MSVRARIASVLHGWAFRLDPSAGHSKNIVVNIVRPEDTDEVLQAIVRVMERQHYARALAQSKGY